MNLFVFGLGYTAARIAAAVRGLGWGVHATGGAGDLSFDDAGSVRVALAQASHVLSSVPPVADGDAVLQRYADALASRTGWTGYLSSTGVYGDTQGAWADESAAILGRRENRNRADGDWLALGATVFRLPGIYGPGRSPLDRLRDGKAHRVKLPGQVFSRVHVDDIVAAVLASFGAPRGIYNIADDLPCSQNEVVEFASAMLDVSPPPEIALNDAGLSPAARAFYGENRRIANGKAKRVLGWSPRYPSYVEGLRAVSATASPPSAKTEPKAASQVQR